MESKNESLNDLSFPLPTSGAFIAQLKGGDVSILATGWKRVSFDFVGLTLATPQQLKRVYLQVRELRIGRFIVPAAGSRREAILRLDEVQFVVPVDDLLPDTNAPALESIEKAKTGSV